MSNINNQFIELMNQYGINKVPFFFIIDFECEKPLIFKLDELENEDIYFSFGDNKNKRSNRKLIFSKEKLSFSKYKNAFDSVLKNLQRGDSYLVNLTFPVEINVNFNFNEMYKSIKSKYKILYKNDFLVFSPETFIKIEDNQIFSYPMKGTIDASLVDAKQKLEDDAKELAEHYTIVDLIRNDLSIVSKQVKVAKFRYFEKIVTNDKHLLQTSSEIVGELNDNWKSEIGNIICRLLPAGSISGAPKKRTIEIINEAEYQKRGYYTGVAGVFDGEAVDSCVLIRYIENVNGHFFYRAGGGITTQSNCEDEYNELLNKVYVPIV